MLKTTITRRPHIDDAHLPQHLHPLLKQIYASRGMIKNDEDLTLAKLLPPETMLDLKKAALIAVENIIKERSILIIGDFDADGATSTSVCMLALRMFGAKHVDYLIPNRFDYGYGLSVEIVALAKEKNAHLLITVDNGISSIEGVAAAKNNNMQVIVTDHHLPGKTLPAADALVNPNQHDCHFASKSIAGVGVAFYLMLAIRAELRKRNWFTEQNIAEPHLASLLDIVALGTVADVVALDVNNRILISNGIKRIKAGKCRPGILALLDIAKRNPQRLVAADFGFAVGPRLNAAGRLDEMALGVETLLCDDIYQAREMASKLDNLNVERRALEAEMQQEALAWLNSVNFSDNHLPWGIVLHQDDWHQGVIGILASRIKDKYHRPVIAFADAGDGLIKGSGRSIKGFHMRDALELINTRYPHLIIKFGGHAMAAGLSIKSAHFDEFFQVFDAVVHELLSVEQLTGKLLTDGELTPDLITMEMAQLLRDAGPWGQGFEEPIFDGHFRVIQQKIVAEKHLKLLLETECGGVMVDGIAFNVDREIWPDPRIQYVKMVYKLDVNEFRGNESLQLMIEHIEPK